MINVHRRTRLGKRFGGIGIAALLALLAAVIKIIMMNAGR